MRHANQLVWFRGLDGLNVSECEFYALVEGAAHGLGLQAYMHDLGIDLLLIIKSDSSNAKAFACPRGLGKQRHAQTRYLWISDTVTANSFVIKKVSTADNISDILTKAINRKNLDRHLKTMGFVEVHASKLHERA